MPAKKNLINKRFGRLVVQKEMPERKNGAIVWECKCDCGKVCYVVTADLNRGAVKSCGCYNVDCHKNKNDLSGKKFGHLTVIEDSGKRTKNREILWKCKCDCGNFCERTTYQLKKGKSDSCGCKYKEKLIASLKKSVRYKDLTGKQIGKLKILERAYPENKKGVYWKCQCSCEKKTIIVVSARELLRGHKTSCGCLKSSGELKIQALLESYDIKFEQQKKFKNCKFPDTNYYAYFDFWVDNKYIIEFDGKQHFQKVNFGKNKKSEVFLEKQLEKIQSHDKFKNNWCKNNNIPIIRIPYTHFKRIKIEDLLLETSNFIIQEQ